MAEHSYKVTIQKSASMGEPKHTISTGSWNPGKRPQLSGEDVPDEVLGALKGITPGRGELSGGHQIQVGPDLYWIAWEG